MSRVSLLAVIVCFSVVIGAQQPSATAKLPSPTSDVSNQVSFGYALNKTDYALPNAGTFQGVAGELTHFFNSRWGLTADLEFTLNHNSMHTVGTQSINFNAHDLAYRIGPRYNLVKAGRFVPYVHFLVGGASTHMIYPGNAANNFAPTSGSNFGLSWVAGAGADYHVTHRFGILFEYDDGRRAIDPNGAFWQRFWVGASYRF